VDAFAAGLLELIEDEDLRRGCAAAAIETAAEYTIEAVGQQWEELLGDVWERRAAALTA
jgi:glycosyltransferase involved in cell wall biosynthesis